MLDRASVGIRRLPELAGFFAGPGEEKPGFAVRRCFFEDRFEQAGRLFRLSSAKENVGEPQPRRAGSAFSRDEVAEPRERFVFLSGAIEQFRPQKCPGDVSGVFGEQRFHLPEGFFGSPRSCEEGCAAIVNRGVRGSPCEPGEREVVEPQFGEEPARLDQGRRVTGCPLERFERVQRPESAAQEDSGGHRSVRAEPVRGSRHRVHERGLRRGGPREPPESFPGLRRLRIVGERCGQILDHRLLCGTGERDQKGGDSHPVS